jgi:gamma-glutamyltranspeptidase/glutathione hydrolase
MPFGLRKRKRFVLLLVSAAVLIGAVGAGIHYAMTRDPTPVALDPKIYDDYAGCYEYREGYLVSIRREGSRLLSCAPEHLPRELYPQSETKFFYKGTGGRVIFHRDENGGVDSLTHTHKKWQIRARRLPEPPRNPEGTNGMIAATTGGAALKAGLDILNEGGSAADAAMATALAQVVLAGGSYVSFGGIMMMVYFDAATGQVRFLDAQYNTPMEELNPGSIPKTGGRTALVPGFMAGVQAAHERFGKVPFARLFQPAIALAENGFAISNGLPWFIQTKRSVLSRFPETKRIFTNEKGQFYKDGDWFRQPELAATLKKVSTQGAAFMYDGEWGRKFVEVVRKNGGKISNQDMKNYRATWEEPVHTSYRDYEVFGPGFTSWGGVSSIGAINLVERANLKALGHYTTSPESFLWLAQITACDHLTWAQQAEFSPKARVSKATAGRIWDQMQNGTWRFLPKALKKNGSAHTDGLVVVDRWGNMAAVNHTINTMLWGNTGLFVDGVSIPDSASFQPGEIEKAGPGHRLPNGMSPLIVLKEGKPVLGSCATGGGLHQKTIQVLSSILDFGMEPQIAVDTPAFIQNGWGSATVDQWAFEPKLIERVKELGMDVRVGFSGDAGVMIGYWVGIRIDPTTGIRSAGVSGGFLGRVGITE